MLIKKIYGFILGRVYKFQMFIRKISLFGTNYQSDIRIYGKIKIFGIRSNITIGSNCSLNEGVILSSNEKITIGNNVTLSSYVVLHTGYLVLDSNPRKHEYKPIKIGDNVWIASATIISAGVKIGNNVVVGANSFVNKDLEDNYFYAGSPAKKVYRIEGKNK
ncbi:MAG: acyltransferase [Sulfurovaceae bacterium]|nr:acyltransferase [Sulfurovaceae bacterium]